MIALEAAPGVSLLLPVPPGAAEEPDSALPSLDVSAVPGARVVVRRGFASADLTLRAACVIAPSDRWAPGLQELVLGRATAIATAGVSVASRWEPGPIQAIDDRFEQRVIGRAGERETAAVQHVLAFVGPEHSVLVCSVICGGESGTCPGVVAAVSVRGTLASPPPPSLLVRSVLHVAERPYEAAAAACIAGAALAAWLIARRPKVPGRRFYP